MITITRCPTCGSKRIRRVKRAVECNFRGSVVVVPDVEFEECTDCGEKLYDSEAMRKMESYRPQRAKTRPRRKTA